MRYLLIGIAAAAVIVSAARAQAPPPGAYPPQPVYSGNTYQGYPLLAPTPRDAYRDGTINRWELEQLEGPTPPALQGPSPDGKRGGGSGS